VALHRIHLSWQLSSAAFLRPVKAHLRDRCAARGPRLARGFSMADQATALDQGAKHPVRTSL
jgi:hypothetical protein